MVPSERVMVPRVPDNPAAALGAVPAGTVSGGHSWAQAPVHVEFPVVSVVKWYKVWPLDETSTAPTLALVAADTFGLLCPLVAAVEFGEDDELAPVVVLEHAESTIAVTARRMPVTDRHVVNDGRWTGALSTGPTGAGWGFQKLVHRGGSMQFMAVNTEVTQGMFTQNANSCCTPATLRSERADQVRSW